MNEPEIQENEVWTDENYAAIDAVAPYQPGKPNYTGQEVLERARKRTLAWQQATEQSPSPHSRA